MTAGERAFDLKISETFFRLVTESIRLFSNKKKRLLSINDVVNDRSSSAAQIKDTYRPGSLKEHLRIIPTDGDGVHHIGFCCKQFKTEINRNLNMFH